MFRSLNHSKDKFPGNRSHNKSKTGHDTQM